MSINWNLVRCAFNKHKYGEPVKNESLMRLVKTCFYCRKEVKLSDDYNFKKLESKKLPIIDAIKNDSFIEASELLDELLKEYGYNKDNTL